MANPEHVALVRKGTKAIAEWRQAHPKEKLDLSGANLSGANLSDADVRGANLSGAKLWRTHLSGADLRLANLSGADLRLANLSEANLRRAKLNGADLTLANLTVANLIRTNLSDANLRDANLRNANLSEALFADTSLGNTYLSETRGLETARHFAPSSIGVDTLIGSVRGAGGKPTPELTAFFRGAGVPQELLDALPGIVAEIKHYSCFISYGEPDVGFATRLDGDLRARNVNCWTYEKDKTVGKPTWGEIEEKLDEYERIVVLCSIKALIRDGFKKEVDKQIDKNSDKLIPVSLDDDWKQHGFKAEWAGRDLKTWLLDRNYADFANKPYEEALEELLKGLRRPEAKKPRRKKG